MNTSSLVGFIMWCMFVKKVSFHQRQEVYLVLLKEELKIYHHVIPSDEVVTFIWLKMDHTQKVGAYSKI